MPDGRPRFLLGHGHRLTSDIRVPKNFPDVDPPYTFDEAKSRVAPMLVQAVEEANRIPREASPEGFVVSRLVIHPQYTAKSYFPSKLLQEVGLEAIGSRSANVVPERLRKKRSTTEAMETVELFVSGHRNDLLAWSSQLPYWTEDNRGAGQLFEVEKFATMTGADRVRSSSIPAEEGNKRSRELMLEAVLHTTGQVGADDVIAAFSQFAGSYGVEPDLDRRFDIGGLTFLPIRIMREAVEPVSNFTFLRIIRGLPSLRPVGSIARSFQVPRSFPCSIPTSNAVDPSLRVAVFDGGSPNPDGLGGYVTLHEPAGLGNSVRQFESHGHKVTSALLFGHIPDGGELPTPYSNVDLFRVLDDQSGNNPLQLYDVLGRIRDALQSKRYEFVNISIGPTLPIDDDDVHPWTAVIDDLLSDANTLASVAVGNDGQKDWPSGNARVQVPSDSVNALSVGACTSLGDTWERAPYSCIGFGRSPGRIKPDVLAFGGHDLEQFLVLNENCARAVGTEGTSFASPLALRQAIGIRAHFGDLLTPLSIKSLMVHCADRQEGHDRREVGWGRVPSELDRFVVCPDGVVRVVYQGDLSAAQWMRAQIPLPTGLPNTRVEICATFCIASATDPQDPSNYTRSGLEITFRPHSEKRSQGGGVHATSGGFFKSSDFDSENELRRNAHKWETVLHASRRFNASSLHDPVFDVHYQSRMAGKPTRAGDKIKYSLIVTIRAPKVADLYDQVLRRYQTILEPLQPRIDIPVRVSS
jgi:hypothetical protein